MVLETSLLVYLKLRGRRNNFRVIATKKLFVQQSHENVSLCPHVMYPYLQLFSLLVFVAETKNFPNRFEFFCFSNNKFMLQMSVVKQSRVPAPSEQFFATFFILTNQIHTTHNNFLGFYAFSHVRVLFM